MAVSLPVPPDPRRLLVVGDTHSISRNIRAVVDRAAELDCDAILSVGDLGYWPRGSSGQVFIAKLRRALSRVGIDLYFVEGNHDDLDVLFDGELPRVGPFRLAISSYRRAARGNVFHIPRGARWSWGGVRFLGVGGGYSIDQDDCREGFDWFPRETISFAEKDAIVAAGGEADVVVAHDCPAGLLYLSQFEDFHGSTLNRERVAAICASAQALLILHGHYHAFHDTVQHDASRGIHARVVGLDCVYTDEIDNRSSFVLDLDELAAAAPDLRGELYGSTLTSTA